MRNMVKIGFVFVSLSFSVVAGTLYDPDDLKKFKETNNCVGCNLSGAILSDGRQRANLEGANMSGSFVHSDYSGANMKGINGSRLECMGNFSQVSFNNAVLIEAKFVGTNLTGADFTGANVRGASFRNANLYGSKITQEQLNSAASICDAILPDGSKGSCS